MQKTRPRPQGYIDLLKHGIEASRIGEVARMLIGKGGSGIRRYTSAVNGSFVKLQEGKELLFDQKRGNLDMCVYIYISGRTLEDVQTVAKMINQDIVNYLSGVNVVRPWLIVVAPEDRDSIGFVIGRDGMNLKRIQRFVGEDCFIVHDSVSQIFRITANSTNACRLAECKIVDSIRELKQRSKKPLRIANVEKPKTLGSRYECISIEEDSTSENDVVSATSSMVEEEEDRFEGGWKKCSKDVRKKRRTEYKKEESEVERFLFDNSSISSSGSIASIRASEQERRRVREYLSKEIDSEGHSRYRDIDLWDRERKCWVKVTGVGAVPWEDVDKEINRKSKLEVSSRRSAGDVERNTGGRIIEWNAKPIARGCWSNPSSNLWDSKGVESLNAEESSRRKTKSSDYRLESNEDFLDDNFLDEYDMIDLSVV